MFLLSIFQKLWIIFTGLNRTGNLAAFVRAEVRVTLLKQQLTGVLCGLNPNTSHGLDEVQQPSAKNLRLIFSGQCLCFQPFLCCFTPTSSLGTSNDLWYNCEPWTSEPTLSYFPYPLNCYFLNNTTTYSSVSPFVPLSRAKWLSLPFGHHCIFYRPII